MKKPGDDSDSALFLTPELPYPAIGGGPIRSAALLEYLVRRYTVDVITFRENQTEVDIPGVRRLMIVDLPHHSKSPAARAWRNSRRFVQGRPPLLDRYSGFESRMESLLNGARYAVCVVEHFWCATYADLLRRHAGRLALDLHNIESTLAATTAESERWPVSSMFRRFGAAYRALERDYLPRFDDLLVTSARDAQLVTGAARVYPNTIPLVELPRVPEIDAIAFSGNLEYAPNVSAVRFFSRDIWPRIHARQPNLEWRLIGKNPHAIRRYVERLPGARIVGPVDNAIEALASAKVVIVPLLAGSGTRFKILEAWAAGRAVVSTGIGAEGLDAIDGEHLLIADDAGTFAAAVDRLLTAPDLREQLGRNGRQLYVDRFTTEAGWRALEQIGL